MPRTGAPTFKDPALTAFVSLATYAFRSLALAAFAADVLVVELEVGLEVSWSITKSTMVDPCLTLTIRIRSIEMPRKAAILSTKEVCIPFL